MDKHELNKEAKRIFEAWCEKKLQIEKDAKASGNWIYGGLDSNQYLFKELWLETQKQLKELKAKANDDNISGEGI